MEEWYHRERRGACPVTPASDLGGGSRMETVFHGSAPWRTSLFTSHVRAARWAAALVRTPVPAGSNVVEFSVV